MEPLEKDLIIAQYKKRSRMMSVVAVVMVLLTFIFYIYSFVQKGIAYENRLEAVDKAISAQKNALMADSLKIKLVQCTEAARMQQQMAEQAAEQAHQAQQMAEEALQKALKK